MIRVDPDTILPILRVRAGDVPDRGPRRSAILREPSVSRRGSRDADEISRNREYVLFGGTHRGERIGVVSHGVGSAGAAVCFEELCRSGATADRARRHDGRAAAATCSTAASSIVTRRRPRRGRHVRSSSRPAFPALASVDLVVALRAAAAGAGVPVVEGVVLTSDLFYPHDVLGGDLVAVAARRRRGGRDGVRCTVRHGRAATASRPARSSPSTATRSLRRDDDMSGYDPHRSVVADAIDAMIGAALDVVAAPLTTGAIDEPASFMDRKRDELRARGIDPRPAPARAVRDRSVPRAAPRTGAHVRHRLTSGR